MQKQVPEVSIVVPLLNEQDNIGILHQQICDALEGKYNYEVIFIDDGSTDNSFGELLKLHENNKK